MYQGCFKGVTACVGSKPAGDSVADILNNNADDIVAQFYQHQDSQPTYPMTSQNQNQNNQQTYQTSRPMQTQNQPIYQPTSQSQNQPTYPTPSRNQKQPPPPTKEPSLPPWTNAPFNPSPSTAKKTVIGYYASWQWYDRNKLADPAKIDFSKYDRINYAFFQPDTEGNVYGTDDWADPQLLWGPYDWSNAGPTHCSWDRPGPAGRKCAHHDESRGMIALAHGVGTEVWPSIGGWTLSDNFPGIAASAAKREHFARQCVELIEAYGFDGVDIDWEYPGYKDHSGTPADTENFTLLLRAIRSKLDRLGSLRNRFYGLTAALPCGPDKIDKIEVNKIKDILTELNLMSYDLHGSWDVLTGTNAPMFDQGWTDQTKRWSVHGCVNNYVDLGVPLTKLNIGLPFYGRSFRGATGMKQTHGGADDINYHLDEGSPQYFNIVNELKGMTTYRHEKTQTQYAVFNIGGGLVSYDDPRAICDKVGYANERGLHGFLIWEISGDMIDMGSGPMATPLIDAVNTKIRNPDFRCSKLRDPQWALADRNYRYAPDEPESVDWSNYAGPALSAGSANDFNGAGIAVPAPGPTMSVYSTPANVVYSSPAGNAGSSNQAQTINSGRDACPSGHTGYIPTAGCTSYVNCLGGRTMGVAQPCSPGTLFSMSIGGCTWAATVQCDTP